MSKFSNAIYNKWPNANCVISGDTIAEWHGPGIQPTSAEIQSAINDYTNNELTIIKDKEANNLDVDLKFRALAQLDYEERLKLQVKAGQTLRTPAECRLRLKEIYRSLL